MEIAGVPVFYIVPIVIFGPILFGVLWTFGLKDVIKPPPEDIEARRLRKETEQASRNTRKGGKAHFTRGGGPGKGPVPWVVQGIGYALFMALLGLLSAWPPYAALGPGTAMIKLSLSHPGQHKVECRKLTREELAALPPNMRRATKCSRDRWPVTVELDLDGDTVFSGSATPRGLSEDGPSSFYERFVVPAGEHRLVIRMRDGAPDSAFNHVKERALTLAPAQSLVVGFHQASGGLVIE